MLLSRRCQRLTMRRQSEGWVPILTMNQASQVSEVEGKSRCQEHMRSCRQEACDLHDDSRLRSKDIDDGMEEEEEEGEEEGAKGKMSPLPGDCLYPLLLKV